ncbi:MAG: M20/M25/M40 family metallo-hydrolase [candidate division WOR-3 bacterium]|nr:MAG: M20/M25/M40 family metallo-hydrolase [candidate division WOR-3 bacterium]
MISVYMCIFVIISINPKIQEMVDSVSSDSILATVQRLQNFVSRDVMHDSCFAAADWIQNRLNSYGLDSVYRDSFEWTYVVPPNIVGIKYGTVFPDIYYAVICGHFDSYSPSHDSAPGADDNASGVAAVLEAARILGNYPFEYSIRFIAFSTEEYGDIGSEHYASEAVSSGDTIIGLFNFDMIGYSNAYPESVEVCGDTFNEPLIDLYIACADTYTTLLATKRLGLPMGDAWQFSTRGYQAATLIEDWWITNPYYHWGADTIGMGFNDLAFCTEITKAGIAALASLSKPTGIAETDHLTVPKSTVILISPNPFSNRTNITYTIHDAGYTMTNTTVKIYDAAGRLVKSLHPVSRIPHGESNIFWTGDDDAGRELGSGVYFLKLDSGDYAATEKLMLIR